MQILSSFTHPQVVPNLHKFLSLSKHKRKYFETKHCWFPLTSVVWKKKILWKSMGTRNSIFSKLLLLCLEKKLIQVWNNLRVGKQWQNLHFEWTIPLNIQRDGRFHEILNLAMQGLMHNSFQNRLITILSNTLLKIKVLHISDAIEEPFLVPQRSIQSKNHLFLTFLESEEPSFTTKNLLWNRKVLQMLKVLYGTI